MTVLDCLREYETVGSRVFGKPRFFTQIRFGIFRRAKFRESDLEEVVQEVTNRRCERRPLGSDPVPFHVNYWEDLCRTSVDTFPYQRNIVPAQCHILFDLIVID
jgi:hypothetical protein